MGALISMLTARRRELLLIGLFSAAAIARLALDFGPGYKGDVGFYLAQTWKIVHYGVQSAYTKIDRVRPFDNPPVLLYPFWLVGWLYKQFISPSFPPPWLSEPVALRFMLRLPSLIADLLAGVLIFRTVQQREPGSQVQLIATGAYLFNLAIIFDSAYWGQTAAVHSLFMLLSLIAIDRRAYGWTGAAFGAAVLTKPQAFAIAGIILILIVRERGLLRFSIAGVFTAVLITAPFLLSGTFDGVITQYLHTTDIDTVVSANAHNLWWFVTGGDGWRLDTVRVGPLSYRQLGLMLFAAATLLSVAVIWRDRKMLFLAASYESLAFYMLNTQIHENHSLAMFAPLAIAVASDRGVWWLCGAFTVTSLVNMTLHDPALLTWAGYDDVLGGSALAIPRWLNSATQLLLFGAFTWRLISHLLRGKSTTTSTTSSGLLPTKAC